MNFLTDYTYDPIRSHEADAAIRAAQAEILKRLPQNKLLAIASTVFRIRSLESTRENEEEPQILYSGQSAKLQHDLIRGASDGFGTLAIAREALTPFIARPSDMVCYDAVSKLMLPDLFMIQDMDRVMERIHSNVDPFVYDPLPKTPPKDQPSRIGWLKRAYI